VHPSQQARGPSLRRAARRTAWACGQQKYVCSRNASCTHAGTLTLVICLPRCPDVFAPHCASAARGIAVQATSKRANPPPCTSVAVPGRALGPAQTSRLRLRGKFNFHRTRAVLGSTPGGGMPAGDARDSPVRPLHSGQLAKKTRSLFAVWQSRFCVLVGVRGAPSVTLRYWDSERAYKKDPRLARGEICMRVDPCNVLAHKVAGPVPTMHLQLPGRTWQFRAQEERQIDDWVGVFKKLADSRAEHAKQAAARAACSEPEPEPLPSVGELGMRIALRSRCEGHSAI
jgi:hypothetical protein